MTNCIMNLGRPGSTYLPLVVGGEPGSVSICSPWADDSICSCLPRTTGPAPPSAPPGASPPGTEPWPGSGSGTASPWPGPGSGSGSGSGTVSPWRCSEAWGYI